MSKLLVADYDNTLYTDEESIYKNIECIKEFRKQNKFIIATGRSYADFMYLTKEYPLEYDYLILGHGTMILDNQNKLIKVYELGIDNASKILDCASNFELKDTIIYDYYNKRIDRDSLSITKILFETNTKEEAFLLANKVNSEVPNVTAIPIVVNEFLVEIFSSVTDKSNAIKNILEIEPIEKENVYVIGDGLTDLKMIQDYKGYGMTNSEPEVIEYSTKLYDHVYELIMDIMEDDK